MTLNSDLTFVYNSFWLPLPQLIYITLALSGSKNVRDITEKNSNHRYLLLHMGMTGRISSPLSVPTLISLPANDSYPPPHTHLTLKTNTGEASFSDPRRFGSVSLQSSMDEVDGLSPDALSFEINSAAELLQGNRKGVKEILLDQKKCVSGVGNWVADEVCYQCEMHPNQTNLGREVRKNRIFSCTEVVVKDSNSNSVPGLRENLGKGKRDLYDSSCLWFVAVSWGMVVPLPLDEGKSEGRIR